MHSKIIIIMLGIFSFTFPLIIQAQPNFNDDTNDVPIDGGLSLLVAAGVGYGAKKLKEKKANSEKG